MTFEILTAKEREALYEKRAHQWKGALAPEHYIQRNYALYAHSYGKNQITTFALKSGGKLVASMDALCIKILTNQGEKEGYLIASVITEPEERKKGYASQMLSRFMDEKKRFPMILYSDIAPEFYERFGFKENRMYSNEEFVQVRPKPILQTLHQVEFCERLTEERVGRLRTFESGVAVKAEATFLDWHVERFRAFASIAGKPFSEKLNFLVHGNHLLAVAPNYLLGWLGALWMDPSCGSCKQALHWLANYFGLQKVYFWSSEPVPNCKSQVEKPMARLSEETVGFFVNPQYLDAW